jgi:hypothetical protein
MLRSKTRGRLYFLLTTVLIALLVATLPGLASAHPGRGGKHTDAPRVQDLFNTGPPANAIAPPAGQTITCTWRHAVQGQQVNAYVCRNNNGSYNQRLTIDQGPQMGQGLLQAGGGDADYEVANPGRFTCNKVAPPNLPSSWACSYDDVHFRMHEMVMMEDPAEPAPGEQEILYAWPPRFPPHD